MNPSRRSASLLALAAAVSCRGERTPPARESTDVVPAATPESTTAAPAAWNPTAGPVLLVASDTPTHAIVLLPSGTSAATLTAIPHPASVTLFSRSGTVQTADLPTLPDTAACSVATLEAAPPPRPWNVGFIGGVVAPVPVDSSESLSPSDSTALVTWLNRMASSLPNDSAGRFSGLPFVVRNIWRFSLTGGPQVVVGTLVRQINQEATPLQERTFLVGERSAADSSFSRVYSERSTGDEETVESTELLAVVQLGDARHGAIVVTRDFGNATAFGVIERGDDGKWRARWSSSRRQC
jgi:hypothetical protein